MSDEDAESRFPAAVPAPFMVVEDLLRVSGMTRTVYDRVRLALHAQSGGVPGVDPLAAQGGALQALANGDAALVDVVMNRRQEESIMDFAPPSGLSQEFLATAAAAYLGRHGWAHRCRSLAFYPGVPDRGSQPGYRHESVEHNAIRFSALEPVWP